MKIAKRTSLFILIGLLTFALGVWMTPRREQAQLLLVVQESPWQMLLTFENQDLQKLDQPSKRMVQNTLAAITGKRYENVRRGEFEPALFRSMSNSKGQKRYVLVELATLWMIPGSSTLRIHVFDSAGHILNAQEFDTGNRTFVTSMRISQYGAIERRLLIVEGQYALSNHPFTQFYSLTSDRMEMVENNK